MAIQAKSIPVPDKKGLRDFAFVTGGIIAGLFGIFFPWLFEVASPRWPWVLGLVLVAAGIIVPARLGPVYIGWMKFGLLLSKVTTPIILGIVYYLVITPTGLVRRLFVGDTLTKTSDFKDSYRTASKDPAGNNMERPF